MSSASRHVRKGRKYDVVLSHLLSRIQLSIDTHQHGLSRIIPQRTRSILSGHVSPFVLFERCFDLDPLTTQIHPAHGRLLQ